MRQVPPVTLEWPAGSPGHPTPRGAPWPPVAMAATSLALVLLLVPGALDAIDPFVGNPVASLVALAVAYLLFSLLADGLSRGWARLGEERPLSRRGACMLVEQGEEPRDAAKRLRAMDVPEGRARLCRDVAVRCLEGAARSGRLEARLRREAAGWLRQMFTEMK